jgi:elongator complex protein 3
MQLIKFEKKVLREIIEELKRQKNFTSKTVEVAAKKISKKYNLKDMPSMIQILDACTEEEKELLKNILITKPIRTISGVNIITVATKPVDCAWGKCIYCPKGKNAPKSYTGLEPAIQRAIRKNYDSFLQVQDRLQQYKLMGHISEGHSKVEVIVIGGTFLGLEREYKEQFIKGIFDGLNGKVGKNLKEAQKMNEDSKNRCVNLTLETRPDFCKEEHVDEMLDYGVTRVEIGVQSIYPDVLEKINRGHTVEDVIDANRITKNSGLKTCFHIMPNLPGSDLEKDLKMFRIIFEDQNFRPDYLKIYPTVVVEGTVLHEMLKKGKYKPYSLEELVELLAKAKKFIPKYCRIQRMGRDIPATEIEAGYKRTNLRELVQEKAKELKISCNCIRCREVGFKNKQGVLPEIKHIKLCRLDYKASGSKEIFLSFEDVKNNILLGFLRLRLPEESHRKEINEKTGLVRDLKVLGSSVPVGLLPEQMQWQHRGYGKQLMEEAERIAREEFDKKEMVVISAIGTRKYYYDLGYRLKKPFVSKSL